MQELALINRTLSPPPPPLLPHEETEGRGYGYT